MSKIRIVLNKKGVRELLRSEEMMTVCKEKAKEIRHNCGKDYGENYRVGKNRVNVSIFPVTAKAYEENLENNTMLKALGK